MSDDPVLDEVLRWAEGARRRWRHQRYSEGRAVSAAIRACWRSGEVSSPEFIAACERREAATAWRRKLDNFIAWLYEEQGW